jgi:hypothetical protein
MKRFLLALTIALSTFFPPIAQAGSSEAGNPVLPAADVATFSDRVQQDLAKRGAHVAIVARIGRNPAQLPKGVTYTHVAFWVFSDITNANGTKGQGYRVYNLYQNSENSAKSSLVQDSPADFFAGAHHLNAGIIIPDLRLQKKLLQVIASPTYKALHNPRYAVLSNPNNSQFQNCTEHLLDVIMASLYNTKDKAQIKANLAAHFTPQQIPLDPTKRALAGIASRGLTTADHGATVNTATFSSIARFMRANKLQSEIYKITPTATKRL